MNRTDDRADKSLPVTGEVGGEGGSFADPTHQVSTFRGDIERTGGAGGSASAATQASHRDQMSGSDPDRGMIRYPTEPPSPAGATEGRRIGTGAWRHGLIGAAAGAAVAFGITRLRNRSRG
jgi:hypothetical protein